MMQKPLQKSFSKEYETYEQSISGSKPEKSFSKEYDEMKSFQKFRRNMKEVFLQSTT